MVAFSHTGPIWVVTLDEKESQNNLPAVMGAGAPLALAAGPLAPVVLGTMAAGYPISLK
jgi:hypothetical protein